MWEDDKQRDGEEVPVRVVDRRRFHETPDGDIEEVQLIARGRSVRDRARLRKQYGHGPWKKLKGIATIRLRSGVTCRAEIHWYEAHGVGRRKLKIKRFLE